MVIVDPIQGGRRPRDLIREEAFKDVRGTFPKRQEVLIKLNSILSNSTYPSAFTGTSELTPFVHVWVHEKSSDADIENIMKLFELNGATRGETKGTMFMDDVEIHVLRNLRVYHCEEE